MYLSKLRKMGERISMADEERKKEEHEKSAKPQESLVEKSLDTQSYDVWVFENYIKERLRALGVVQ